MRRVLFGLLKIRSAVHVNGTFSEVQQFILFGMHRPLVARAGRLHREDTTVTPVELHREELHRWRRAITASRLTVAAAPL
jgi:hypothetical protein